MNYLLCPACNQVKPAAVTHNDRILCSECGTALKIRQLCCKQCPECGNLLYAPPVALEKAVFPCAQEHLREKEARRKQQEAVEETLREMEARQLEAEAQASPQPPADSEEAAVSQPDGSDGYPPIPCEYCGQMISAVHGEYGACPACGRQPSPSHAFGQLYANGGPLKPIQIKWEPAMNEMVCVHTRSDAIPPYSVLIVGENQAAIYCSGGASLSLSAGKTYALFDDPRTEEEIVEGIYRGNSMEDSLGYRINTKIVFFDLRSQNAAFQASFRLRDWYVQLPVDMDIKICAPETLLRTNQNFSDGRAVTEDLKAQAKAAVLQEINERVLAVSADRLAEAQTEDDFRQILADTLIGEADAIRQQASLPLIRRGGLQIPFLRFRLAEAACVDIRQAETVECPACSTVYWVRSGKRSAVKCPACGQSVSWCFTCRRFTPSRQTASGTEECVICGYAKI